MPIRSPLLSSLLAPSIASLLGITLIAGCGTVKSTPTGVHAESSSASIRAAEEVGATHSPEAALHLQLAKEQFEAARKMDNPDDRDHADRLLMRSQADAELALALARTETEKTEAQGAVARVKALKDSAPQ